MTNQCFISYSTADGVNLLQNLVRELEGGTPYIPAWYDTRNIPPGSNWDDEIVEAIKTCKCMLFIMSNDSTKPSSDCRKEILFALKYKKPIIPLKIHPNAEPVFMIATREWIDFVDFNVGLGKLRKYIQELDLPVGQLRLLNERLSDAEHDLRRATAEEAIRIKAEIEDLNKQIESQKKIADNPQAAAKQTQINIEAGLERERKPEKPVATKTETKFINPPPGYAPNYFQDRYDETKEILRFLNDDSQRLMTIVGRGGVGKTAMVCRLLKGLEGGELPDGLGNMRVEGIVYLSESGSHRVNFANLFYNLCKLLPADAANALDTVYKNPQASTTSKMSSLLDRFTAGKVVLLLDNVEPLISVETFDVADAELDECLRALLHGAHSALKVILTTRVAPRGLNLCEPGRQRVLTLDSGLEQKYAVEMLREMDVDGKLGLKSADAEALKRAYERTLGFPRALEALFAILASDRYTTLEELLAMPTPVNVVEALVGEAFNRLDTNAQKVMQALAVYNRPVTPAAVDYLLAPHLPAMDSAPILQRLVSMHFARRFEGGKFYLHPVDRDFAISLLPEGNVNDKIRDNSGLKFLEYLNEAISRYPDLSENQEAFEKAEQEYPPNFLRDIVSSIQSLDPALQEKMQDAKNFEDESYLTALDNAIRIPQAYTKYALTNRAADYFAQARKPRAQWKKMDDLSAQLAEFDLRCAAGDYDSAASVLIEIDFEYLLLWGHYRLMIDLHQKLHGKISNKELARVSANNLGLSNKSIGKLDIAIKYFEHMLELAQQDKAKQHEGAALGNLGGTYATWGNVRKAIEYYEQALVIAREIGDRRGEGNRLGNLGFSYNHLNEAQKAIEHHEQALIIFREIGDRRGESNSLGNIGLALLNQESYQRAQFVFLQSIQIGDEISNVDVQIEERWGLAQAYLFQGDLPNACTAIESALQYDAPEYNHNASALHGIIALRQGDASAARGAFVRAIGQADEILSKTAEYYSALDAKGLALCGLILCGRGVVPTPEGLAQTGREDLAPTLDDAIETFKKARKIAPHAGVVKSVLRLFDELVKCDTEGILKEVRSAVEGKE